MGDNVYVYQDGKNVTVYQDGKNVAANNITILHTCRLIQTEKILSISARGDHCSLQISLKLFVALV